MERTRQPLPPVEASDALPAPVAGPSPRALLEVLREPGVERSDVDAFFQALGQPPSEGETPRERADFLLSLLEDASVRDVTGGDGRSVRAAAVEGLLALGYPYALEISPEVLAQVRGEPSEAPGVQKVLVVGLVLAALAVLTQGGIATWALQQVHVPPNLLTGVLVLGAAVLPALLAVLGGGWRMRWAQRVGVTLMALMGGAFLARCAKELLLPAMGHADAQVLLFSVPGALLLTSAGLLRGPWKPEAP